VCVREREGETRITLGPVMRSGLKYTFFCCAQSPTFYNTKALGKIFRVGKFKKSRKEWKNIMMKHDWIILLVNNLCFIIHTRFVTYWLILY